MNLIATVGTSKYSPVEYHLAANPDRFCRTCYGPVATADLAGPVSEAIILLTKEAEEQHWMPLKSEFEKRGIRAWKLEIPLGRTETEIWFLVALLNDRIEKGAELIVDITHAFRHLPILMLTSLAYLTGERNVKIRGIYYGAYEARTGDRAPVFDLTPFLTLIDCYHAIRQFRETGDARRLAKHLKETNANFWRFGERPQELSALSGALADLSASLVAALPLEAGLQSRHAIRNLAPALAYIVPKHAVAGSLVGAIATTIGDFVLEQETPDKAGIELNLNELARQLRIACFFMNCQAYDRALLLLREWVVSRCLLADGKTSAWLDYHMARKPMESRLSSIAERIRADRSTVSETQIELASLWSQITSLRNPMAHAGMCPNEINPESDITGLIKQCETRLNDQSVEGRPRVCLE